MVRPVNGVEADGLGHTPQVAVEPVGPGVIRARKSASMPARFVLDSCTPMSADVEECLDVTVVSSGDQERHAGVVVGQEIAHCGQLRVMGDDNGEVPEQDVDLLLELIRVGVLVDRVVHDLRQHVREVLIILIEDPADDVALFRTDWHGCNRSVRVDR